MATKKKVLSLILFAMVAFACQAEIKVEVSETVELMGVLSRTAGFDEYCQDVAGQYSKDTEMWFASYRQHPTVVYYQELRNKYGIGYDRVTNMGVHLEISKGKVKLAGDREELDNGWQNVNLDEFVDRLNKFYKETRFHDFYEQHRAFYDEGLKDFETNVMPVFHQDWYSRFYGNEASEQFHVLIGFTLGRNNNGARRQLEGKPKDVFAVMGYNINPQMGRPSWDASILIHEFNHSFVNPLLDIPANAAKMEKVGAKLFLFSKFLMERQAYNTWQIVINESIVRAAVYIYMRDYGLINKGTLNFLFDEVWNNGFQWVPELVESLRYYASHREEYKTLNDYYPEIVSCLSKYITDEALRLQKVLK